MNYDRTKMCAHLRSKNMYTDPDPEAAENTPSDQAQNFWCNLTMRNLGPDDVLCDTGRCCAERWCYRSIFD